MSLLKIFTFFFSAIAFLFAAPVSAQEADYSGSWELDKANSTLQGWTAENLLSMNMGISHENKNLRIVYSYSFTNGSSVDTLHILIGGESISGNWWNGRIDYTSQARMDDEKTSLILETESTYRGQNGSFTTHYTDAIHLSEDKHSLIIDRITKTDFETSTSTLVFTPTDAGKTK